MQLLPTCSTSEIGITYHANFFLKRLVGNTTSNVNPNPTMAVLNKLVRSVKIIKKIICPALNL